MMQKFLFDASVYIQTMRDRRSEFLTWRHVRVEKVYFSAVVGAELLRGARNAKVQSDLQKLWQDFKKLRRLVVPEAGDWHDAGIVLARIAEKYGYESIGQARLVHDALIALSARRQGITIVTLNVADFERIREFRRFSLVPAPDFTH